MPDDALISPPRPPIALRKLILLNAAGILFLCLANARWPIGTILALAEAAFLLIVSGVWHAIVYALDRKFSLHPALRVTAHMLPLLGLIFLFVLSFLGFGPPQAVNQKYPAPSPSGHYTAYVSAPGPSWEIRIKDTHGETFEDLTEFPGRFNAYWIWDQDDRLWFYNSDDGGVHYWERETGGPWQRHPWGSAAAQYGTTLTPPRDLYPDYAKNP